MKSCLSHAVILQLLGVLRKQRRVLTSTSSFELVSKDGFILRFEDDQSDPSSVWDPAVKLYTVYRNSRRSYVYVSLGIKNKPIHH